ncbi:MAG: LuxR family transcriptional regulator, partial [Anaerolineae bacterium]
MIDTQPVDASISVDMALTFLLEHLPPQMHLVIASRIDPALPLSRLRAGGQMTEIREADLRFSADESNEFLGKVMGLNLSAENVAALEARIEGWIAGLQLAALSMRGLQEGSDIADFIDRFTSSDRYIHDYLTDEVLRQQPQGTRDFLMQTSILDRLSGPLCDAVTKRKDSQAILEALEAANLFIVPLDNERCWYRYHALFCDLLRQRLYQSTASSAGDEGQGVAEYHIRASEWYENNGLEIDAFHHAAAANDIERAARLMEGDWMPLPFRGAVRPVLNWLKSLPATVLDARPLLWVTYASTLLGAGQRTGVEQKLQAAETALAASAALGVELDDKTRDLVGRIAAVRATLAISQHQVETIIAQSHRALEYLHPDNLAFRTSTTWKLGYAYHLQGDHAAASRAYTEAMSIGQASGNILFTVSAMLGLGSLQETANQLYLAAESYRRALHLFGDQPLPALACEAHLGLARIFYEWNDLDAAQQHRQQSVQLVRQTEGNDTFATCEVFLARLKLAEGDVAGAADVLAQADQFVRQHNLVNRMPEVAAAQVRTMLWQGPQLQQKPLLHQGNLAAAADLAETHELPISQARVHLAQGDTSAALAALGPLCQQMEAKGLANERLKVMVLQAVAHYAAALQADGEKEEAVQFLGDTLALAEPGGFIRLFVDEGMPM